MMMVVTVTTVLLDSRLHFVSLVAAAAVIAGRAETHAHTKGTSSVRMRRADGTAEGHRELRLNCAPSSNAARRPVVTGALARRCRMQLVCIQSSRLCVDFAALTVYWKEKQKANPRGMCNFRHNMEASREQCQI
uniref:Putative secreted protein n=1 Tax=Anopheles marajoara TaxID=58244 RepID=A0A2M4C6U1_9DIPT